MLERLVDAGNTVLTVEHNLEVIAAADWVIEMGPEAGAGGGKIVVEGPPEDVVIHAGLWRQGGGPDGDPLLRSNTGEALEGFLGPDRPILPPTSGLPGQSLHRAGVRSPRCRLKS